MRNQGSSLTRALSLLDAFDKGDGELTLTELADRAGLPKSTAHRLVGDLVRWRALERTPNGLRLGMRLFELGHLVPSPRELRDIALPYLEDLHTTTRKTVNLAVRDGIDIVYVEKLLAPNEPVPHSRAGGRLPMHCTALGKAILAYSTPGLLDEVVAAGLRRMTPKTIQDPKALRAELATVRERRIAYDVEESRIGLHCVAAPLFDRRGEIVAAVSVTGMQSRSTARQLAPAVLTASLSLSRQLGA
ncbi:IclR family transcriptional regulator [Plantactinospora soyae]|uniref:DNA-binding IclR family transcriptional regulator n=1 Tax=Plantactinospora soyae TaxID=1544732 RepID=A0A927M889_9ACTN|nr:IclR family transcriptional regulator [Plantactinospora soyae]MBE1488501.1 DNA-binding IclR family transcriptional regulator [Plantactinospora soyae]